MEDMKFGRVPNFDPPRLLDHHYHGFLHQAAPFITIEINHLSLRGEKERFFDCLMGSGVKLSGDEILLEEILPLLTW